MSVFTVFITIERSKDSAVVLSYCLLPVALVAIRCRPFHLPREFTTAFIIGVYSPALMLKRVCVSIMKLQNFHPDGLFIIAGDFIHAVFGLRDKRYEHVRFLHFLLYFIHPSWENF